jgi:hypothetical protein
MTTVLETLIVWATSVRYARYEGDKEDGISCLPPLHCVGDEFPGLRPTLTYDTGINMRTPFSIS